MQKWIITLCLFLLLAQISWADEKISDFGALSEAPASGDLLPIVDVSDTTQGATGSTKKITTTNLLSYLGTQSTIGRAIFTSTNPGAITFGRANADNTFSWLSDSDFRTAIGVIDWTADQGATNIHAGNIPTLNQNTTGTAGGLTAQYIDWNAASGGSSIANKPTIIDWTADQGATNIHAGNIPDLSGTYVAVTANTIDAIGDAAADGTVNFAGYKNIWTSTLNSAGAVHTFTNTTADLTADVSFMDFKYTDDGDTNGFFLRGYDNSGNDLKWSINANGVGSFSSIIAPGGISIAATSAGGQYMFLREDTDNTADNYSGWGIYGELAHSTIYALPLAAPAAGQVMSFAAPGNQTMSDGSTQSVSVGTNVYKDSAQDPVIDDADNFDDNCTGQCLRGGTFIANAAGTIVLPDATSGMNFTISLEGANAVIIDPLGTGTADTIYMNGLAAAQDENITSSTSGAMCIFQYRSADTWMATCNGFAEATPP